MTPWPHTDREGDRRPLRVGASPSRVWILLAVCVCFCMAGACGAPEQPSPDLRLDLALNPSPPRVGDVQVSLRLSDAHEQPLTAARVRLEGGMAHPGMKPVFSELQEAEPGDYSGSIRLTMGGDWYFLFQVTTSEGETTEHTLQVPGVESR